LVLCILLPFNVVMDMVFLQRLDSDAVEAVLLSGSIELLLLIMSRCFPKRINALRIGTAI
jgi:hypothetical protein